MFHYIGLIRTTFLMQMDVGLSERRSVIASNRRLRELERYGRA